MKYLIFLLLVCSQVFAGEPIKCPPPAKKIAWYKPAIHVSARDGDWFSASTWAAGVVPGENDEITVAHKLHTNNRQVIIRGKLKGRSFGLQFRGISERNMVGGLMTPPASDVGLVVLDNGQLELEGEVKKSWTNLTGSALKGQTSITVNNTQGWKPGDEVCVVPTRTPDDSRNWKDFVGPDDSFAKEFERRIITSVSGNTVSFTQPLLYDHRSVTSTVANKTWTAEVMNLSRSIVIEGTTSGYAHIFIRSNKPQIIKHVEGRFLGPTNPIGQRGGGLKQGLYGLHFHHCMEGSVGSVVEGNAFHDLHNRVYVPHFSNGILFKDNVAFNSWEAMYWWDFQDQSHRITYDGNIAALIVHNGVDNQSTGFDIGQGDDNIARNNVSVYTHSGDPHQQGAYSWSANNESNGWVFERNLSHSNRSGYFGWQNTANNHTVLKHEFYNNFIAGQHGAYLNAYQFSDCILFASPLHFEASPGLPLPMFERMIFDGGGQVDYLIEALSSPAPMGPNIFANCVFKNFKKAAFLMNTEIFKDEIGRKIVDIVNPDYTGQLTAFGPKSIYGSYFRVQPKSGQPFQVSQSGTTNISAFAPSVYGTGTGLLGKYYNGSNFDHFAFERVDPTLKFMGWNPDKNSAPNGVHYKINPTGPYSVVWTGEYVNQHSTSVQFGVESWGGVRLTVDNRTVLDRWQEFNERTIRDAAVINLEPGRRYRIRIEHFNTSGDRGFIFYQKVNGQYLVVPMSQLYPTNAPAPPPPQNRPPVVHAGPDRTIQLPDSVIKIEGMVSDPDNNLASFAWSGQGVELTQNLSEAGHVMAKVKLAGTYVLTLTAKDQPGLTTTDVMMLTVVPKAVDTTKPQPPPTPTTLQANAGPDLVIQGNTVTLDASLSTGKIVSYRWYKDVNPGGDLHIVNESAKITQVQRLINGTYEFLLLVKDASGKESWDRIKVFVGSTPVPPVPVWPKIKATFPLEGKKIVVYEQQDGTWTVKIE